MRAVSLSNKAVQKTIIAHTIPLKIVISPGAKEFPLDWAGIRRWSFGYQLVKKGNGYTGCAVISPDGTFELGSTGSVSVWALFDSIAYDANKFKKMLDLSLQRHRQLSAIKNPLKLWQAKRRITREVRKEGRVGSIPRGFTVRKARELFELSGDYIPRHRRKK